MIFKNWINTVFGTSGALTGDEIPYDGSTSVNQKIDANAVTKASQGEVDAGTDDTKFVTPLTLENKPTSATGLLEVKAFGHFEIDGSSVVDILSTNLSMVRDSTGRYTCTILNSAVSDTTYLLRLTQGNEGLAVVRAISEVDYENRSTTSFQLRSDNLSGAAGDVDAWFIEVIEGV